MSVPGPYHRERGHTHGPLDGPFYGRPKDPCDNAWDFPCESPGCYNRFVLHCANEPGRRHIPLGEALNRRERAGWGTRDIKPHPGCRCPQHIDEATIRPEPRYQTMRALITDLRGGEVSA